jgi:LemA protein
VPAVHSKRGRHVCEASPGSSSPPVPVAILTACIRRVRAGQWRAADGRGIARPVADAAPAGAERNAMGKVLGVVGVIVAIGIALLVWGTGVNNRLVTSDQNVGEKWAQVQNVYQRRADLIPNLVETVKGYAAQEREVLEEVTRARASATSIQVTPEMLDNPEALKRFQQAQNELGGALSRLLVTVERYPDLKSNQNFLALQSQLEGTENRIAVERRRFNEAVRDYNTQVKRLPDSLVASIRGFREKAFFEAAPGGEVAPKVKF